MKISQALKEHLELNKEKFVQDIEYENFHGNLIEYAKFDMEALIQEINMFCETFKEKS